LEGLGLEVNPLARTLRPAQQYLLEIDGRVAPHPVVASRLKTPA